VKEKNSKVRHHEMNRKRNGYIFYRINKYFLSNRMNYQKKGKEAKCKKEEEEMAYTISTDGKLLFTWKK
jgi:hypothetical protein